MNLCSEHKKTDIVYNGKDCPLCEAEKKIEGLENELEKLTTERGELYDQLEEIRLHGS